ncbi:MAG: methanogen output domain 1-containing protein [Pseudomonadota bacterium]|nr:methanogen output domain 1-containing protein [Pseudomonadota bacterium]
MTQPDQSKIPVKELEIPLERDVFMRSMLRELAGALQDVVGLEEASGFVSLVGQRIGDQLNKSYREALSQRRLNREQVADVLVDLKRRINGGFSIVEQNDERIVLSNTHCPFAEKVEGRPALCMMTSNVFGNITAENLGYARVDLEETIAEGAPGCRVVIHLNLPMDEQATGREYFRG